MSSILDISDRKQAEDLNRRQDAARMLEHGFELGRDIARQHIRKTLLVLGHGFRRPVRHGRHFAQQFVRRQAHHLAKRRVDVRDADFQVARAQARHEGALRQQMAFRTAMEDSLVTGLRARDLEGRVTYVNPAFCQIVGLPR